MSDTKENLKLDNEILEPYIIYQTTKDLSFFLKVKKYLDTRDSKGKSYFNDDNLQRIYNNICVWYDKYNKIPNKTELNLIFDKIEKDEDKREILRNALDKSFDKPVEEIEYHFLEEEVKNFIKKSRSFEAFLKGKIEVDKGNYGVLPELFEEANNVNFDKDLGISVRDTDLVFNNFNDLEVETIPSNVKTIDININGGFKGSELYCFSGIPGIGKTVFLGKFAIEAAIQGKKALVYTFETSGTRLMQRYYSNFLKESSSKFVLDPEKYSSLVQQFFDSSGFGDLIIKEYPNNTACSNDLRAHINDLIMYKNWKPDIICVDYILIMKANDPRMDSSDSYRYFKRVAEDLRNLAREFNVPLITAAQINRSGMDEGGGSKALTTAKDVSESRGIYDTVDFFATINQTSRMKTKSEIMIYIDKNRNGPNGIKIPMLIDYSTMTVEEKP